MKRISVPLLTAFLLILVLCACGSTKYTLFAYDYEGTPIVPDSMTSVLTLNGNGSGRLVINESSGRISWTLEGENLTLHAGSESFTGTLQDGIAILDLGDGNLLYYASRDADTSSFPVMSFQDYLISNFRADDQE